MSTTKPETGVRRSVVFRAWCNRSLCQWKGPERDVRWMAEYDRAGHELDKHGGAERGNNE